MGDSTRKKTGGGLRKSPKEKEVIKNLLSKYCLEGEYDLENNKDALVVQKYIAKELINLDIKLTKGKSKNGEPLKEKYSQFKLKDNRTGIGVDTHDYSKIISISKLKEALLEAIDENKKPDKLKYIETVLKNKIKEIKLVVDEITTFTAIKSPFQQVEDFKIIVVYNTPYPPCIEIFYELLYNKFDSKVTYIETHFGGAVIHCTKRADCINIQNFINKYK